MSGINFDNSAYVAGATAHLSNVTGQGADLLTTLKGMKFVDANNKPIGPFNSLSEYQGALSQPGVKCTTPNAGAGMGDVSAILGKVGDMLGKLDAAKNMLETMKNGASEYMASLNSMLALLKSGDIEGAVMLLQTSRAKVLETQLATRIEGMQVRNAQIKGLNDALKLEQQKLGAVTGTDAQKQQARDNINATITGIKGDLDKLNSDSQLDMIGIQGLVNKRNEAFDMLSNLLNKFQKTIDGIVGNMR
jgi:hypothetical protein